MIFTLTALALLSCQIILGIDEPKGTVRPPVEAGPPDTGIVDPCPHVVEPPPPQKDDDLETEQNYWLAGERMIIPMTPDDAGVQPGLDLDRSCTCQKDLYDGAPVCETPAQVGSRTFCDFEGGVDDSLSRLALQYSSGVLNFDPSEPINRQIRSGRRTLLMYISKYNGKANDTDVGVAFIGSNGLFTNRGCDDQPRDAGPPQSFPDAALPGTQYGPIWDGCDRWTPLPGLAFGTWPKRSTAVTRAYVNNFMLVVEIKEVVLDIFGTSVKAGNGFAVMRLSREGNGFRGEGFISGRMAFEDLVTVIGRVPTMTSTGETKPLCETTFWPQIAPVFCTARDTMDSPPKDRTGKICNAATATIGIIGRPAQVADGEFESPIKDSFCDAQIDCK